MKKLKVGTDLHCESPLQTLLELKPDTDQVIMSILIEKKCVFIRNHFKVIFEGDTLELRCRAPRIAIGAHRDSEDLPARAHLFWGWSERILEPNSTDDIYYQDPAKVFPSISINARHLSDSGLLDSLLTIPRANQNHSGIWDCRLRSLQANLSHSIAVIVISNETQYCESKVTSGNKGKYVWPQTVRGRWVRLPCAGEGPPNVFAAYECLDSGNWESLNTNDCPFITETTKVLEQFSKVNLTIARGSVLESAKRLRNYTNYELTGLRFYDPMDVVFIAKTLTNYLDFVSNEKDLSSMLLDIVSQVMSFDSKLLQAAQNIDGSCTKLISSVEMTAGFTAPGQAQRTNFALEQFKVRPDSFFGITCTWHKEDVDDVADKRTFQCNTANNGQGIGILERHIDAVIQIPANLFGSVSSQTFMSQQLLVSVFQTSNFFPQNLNQTSFEVTSAVIGAKILNKPISNLSDPIYIMLRAAPFHNELSLPRPVWWDPELNDGAGGWSFHGCHFSQLLHGLLVFACNRLGYYGLLQNTKYLNDFRDETAGAKFRLSPPAFYVGSLILFFCVWINIVSYLAYDVSIQMARRTKHSLINMWLALSFLCYLFCVGIYQTEKYKICQSIGITVHYLSLCVLLWLCVSVSNMYKRISRHDRNIALPVDEVQKESIGRKPILGLYLVGWGIALIICGISGAVNIREYAAYSYCFLKSGPGLSAFFVPAGILIAFLALLFICIRCSIRTPEDIGHMSEGTQGTENVDLDLLEPALPASHANDQYRSTSTSTPTTLDLEHSNESQLKAYIIFLFLYSLSWASAAISVAKPFSDQILYEEEIFSILYAILASVLGIFILFFYGIARNDIRMQWNRASWRNFNRKPCCRSRSISDTASNPNNTPPVIYHQTTGTIRTLSRSNSQSSKTRYPPNSSNVHRGAADLNVLARPRNDSPNAFKTANGNVNLVMLHRQQFMHNSTIHSGSESADIFYNPNQINVARKFFKKQKRLQKRNNFELQRQRDRDCMSDVSSVVSVPRRNPNGFSIFSSGASKVNNTNIHLDRKALLDSAFEKEARQQSLNPNILSDSCNESDLIGDAERIVIGAERLRALAATRAKVNNTPPVVANIYTNVPETAQPQHEIVTMRADDKFKKPINEEDRSRFLIGEEKETVKHCNISEKPHYVNEDFQDGTNQNEHHHQSPCLTFDSETMVLSLDSPIVAMNTVGLPICSSSPTLSHSDDVGHLNLDKNTEYISSALDITSATITRSKKSRSMNDLIDDDIMTTSRICESPVQSLSCTNIIYHSHDEQTVFDSSTVDHSRIALPSESPILFSPSLCDINDIPSPSLAAMCHSIHLESTPAGSETNLFFRPEKIFNPINRNFATSPTSESDINYQNSELSIRSHELYAPPPDNDLNLTLTNDENLFPYQPSEMSDYDEEDPDMDDYNNCSKDCLLTGDGHEDSTGDLLNESQSSIDELYQQIKRRSVGEAGSSQIRRDLNEYVTENDEDSSQCSVLSLIEPNAADQVL